LTVSDANEDFNSIDSALQLARSTKGKPTLITCKTIIGYRTLKENTSKVHGAPLGEKALAEFKNGLGFNPNEEFKVPSEVYAHYKENSIKGMEIEKKWKTMLEGYFKQNPYLASEFKRIFILKELSYNWKSNLPEFSSKMKEAATRNTSGIVLNLIAPLLKELIGGSADLTPSNNTKLECSHDFSTDNPDGRYIRFGVREHAMFSIGNGLSSYGFIPYTATFLNFITYGWGAVRLSALSHLQQEKMDLLTSL
jgi:transketolase